MVRAGERQYSRERYASASVDLVRPSAAERQSNRSSPHAQVMAFSQNCYERVMLPIVRVCILSRFDLNRRIEPRHFAPGFPPQCAACAGPVCSALLCKVRLPGCSTMSSFCASRLRSSLGLLLARVAGLAPKS